jgi:uncharacterized protein YigE (DUF2233 family)
MRLFLTLLLFLAGAAQSYAACEAADFQGHHYTACRFDLGKDRVGLFNLNGNGQPYGFFSSLNDDLAGQGKVLSFAMNGGMYDEGLKPIGLYVEGGKTLHKLNRRNGAGNFHLKPNGVFYVKGNTAGVLETDAYARSGIKADYATQSGPMLVIDGAIHPKFSEGGTSAKYRNGVGAIDGSHVVFAISDQPVTFYDFAVFFRDGLKTRNALFLDGSISSLYAPELSRNDQLRALGPIIGVTQNQ